MRDDISAAGSSESAPRASTSLYSNMWSYLAFVSCAITAFSTAVAGCSPAQFPEPAIPHAQVLDLSAVPVTNYKYNGQSLDFCNVTVTYTHIDWNDTIHTTVWLPFVNWNNRLQGSGGGGFAMKHGPDYLAEAVAANYSVVATDGGHAPILLSSDTWSLDACDNVNMKLFKDFAYVALGDLAIIGKNITGSFYGCPPRYSYWNGCSTGGRQGLMLAQRYPMAFDGILANAPAIYWPSFIVAEYWPQFVMNQLNSYPPRCVLDAITSFAVKACDGIDGVQDGIISAPDQCKFDAMSVVGKEIKCGDVCMPITKNAALVVAKTWEGMKAANGSFLWYGLNRGAPLVRSNNGKTGLVGTKCTTPTNCTGRPFEVAVDWITQFVLEGKMTATELTKIDHERLDEIFYDSKTRYESIIGTNNPDLSGFKSAGGKMITWHGLSDQLIFPGGTEQYYKEVEALDPSVRDYYRFFEVPGVDHCNGGFGPFPKTALDTMVDWVENGIVPETLPGFAADGSRLNICPYPLVAAYKGGDPKVPSSYACQKTF